MKRIDRIWIVAALCFLAALLCLNVARDREQERNIAGLVRVGRMQAEINLFFGRSIFGQAAFDSMLAAHTTKLDSIGGITDDSE
jgi:hypothetical protein